MQRLALDLHLHTRRMFTHNDLLAFHSLLDLRNYFLFMALLRNLILFLSLWLFGFVDMLRASHFIGEVVCVVVVWSGHAVPHGDLVLDAHFSIISVTYLSAVWKA